MKLDEVVNRVRADLCVQSVCVWFSVRTDRSRVLLSRSSFRVNSGRLRIEFDCSFSCVLLLSSVNPLENNYCKILSEDIFFLFCDLLKSKLLDVRAILLSRKKKFKWRFFCVLKKTERKKNSINGGVSATEWICRVRP